MGRYLAEVRPSLVVPPDEGALFLTVDGTGLSPVYLGQVARRYVDRSGVPKTGSCHIFRHTFATLMLEGGADVRYVQAMLGHDELSSTQIYTHVSIRALQAVHAATHPGATNSRHRSERPVPDGTNVAQRHISVFELERQDQEDRARPDGDHLA